MPADRLGTETPSQVVQAKQKTDASARHRHLPSVPEFAAFRIQQTSQLSIASKALLAVIDELK